MVAEKSVPLFVEVNFSLAFGAGKNVQEFFVDGHFFLLVSDSRKDQRNRSADLRRSLNGVGPSPGKQLFYLRRFGRWPVRVMRGVFLFGAERAC